MLHCFDILQRFFNALLGVI